MRPPPDGKRRSASGYAQPARAFTRGTKVWDSLSLKDLLRRLGRRWFRVSPVAKSPRRDRDPTSRQNPSRKASRWGKGAERQTVGS